MPFVSWAFFCGQENEEKRHFQIFKLTVHLFNEESLEKQNDLQNQSPAEFFKKGKQLAKNITAKPYTSKKPRSNSTSGDFDNDEFGM